MRSFCLTALLLGACVGCGEPSTDVVAEQDELAAYVAENPSPTDEEMLAAMSEEENGE